MLRLALSVLLVFPNRETRLLDSETIEPMLLTQSKSPTSWNIFMELHIKKEMDLLMSCGQGSMAASSLEGMWDGQQGNLEVL